MATAREYIQAAGEALGDASDAPLGSETERYHLAKAQVNATLAVAQTLQEFFAPADIGIRPIADLNLPETTTAPADEAAEADQ